MRSTPPAAPKIPGRLEDAVWARESVYSTGSAMDSRFRIARRMRSAANSIGILKLDQPIEWGSLDGNPVRMVILLAHAGIGPKRHST